MAGRYREIYSTPEVLAAQAHFYGQPQPSSSLSRESEAI